MHIIAQKWRKHCVFGMNAVLLHRKNGGERLHKSLTIPVNKEKRKVSFMNFILDIILAVIFIVCVIAGYKKGFVKSFLDLVSNIVAVIVARIISYQLAPAVFSSYFEEGLTKSLGEKVSELGSTASAQVQGALESIPNISGFLSLTGVNEADIAAKVSDSIDAGGLTVTEALMANLVSPVATFILRILIFVIAFIVCVFILKIVARILDKLSKLPLLKQANGAFGFLFGAVKGLIIVIVICAVAQLIAGFIGSGPVNDIVSNSVLVSAFNTVMGSIKF